MPHDPIFERVAAAVEGVPEMRRGQGARVFHHLRRTNAENVLELGTACGTSAAYMAAALEANGRGRVTTLDITRARYKPPPSEVLARAGVANLVELIRVPDSSYTWWLGEQIAARSDEAGNCEPLYDFCYIDGPKNFTIDGLAVILVERLLRPGGWILLDDLRWTYAKGRCNPDHIDTSTFSEAEITEPHITRVFDLILTPHPSFTEFRVDDGWGWAHKAPGQPRRMELARSSTLAKRVMSRARHAVNRFA